MSEVRAPYNFVPFSNTVFLRYDNMDKLPPHNVLNDELKTGEIHITMTADTPVIISDGGTPVAHFVKNAEGTFEIPGSSVRGMVRENMTILGYGHVNSDDTIDDDQIYFRNVAGSRSSLGKNTRDYYYGALGVESKNAVSIPQNVQSGYLCKHGANYVIKPTKGSYLRVPRKKGHPTFQIFQEIGETPARSIKVFYAEQNGKLCDLQTSDAGGLLPGMMLFTGKPAGKDGKPEKGAVRYDVESHQYVFPEPTEDEASFVFLDESDVINYKTDWENRKNQLGEKQQQFWALPEKEGKEKPVFFVHHKGHTYFGMSLFLRIGYQHSITEGLPEKQGKLNSQTPVLDYPQAILGFAGKDRSYRSEESANRSYRSRVSFEGLRAVGNVRELSPVTTILGQPKPSWYPGYVVDGRNYLEDGFVIRGFKQYWLKNAEPVPADPSKEKAATKLCALPKGTVFKGVIRYRNLHEDELGLLLWALRLEKDCYQSIGMAKPCGYGRMKLSIDRLVEYDIHKLYDLSGVECNYCRESADRIDYYISAFKDYAAGMIPGKKMRQLCDLPEIKDFLFIRSVIRKPEEVSYMELREYKNIARPLESIKDVREAAEKAKSNSEPDFSKMTAFERAMYEAEHRR